jgi:hypothetical protein
MKKLSITILTVFLFTLFTGVVLAKKPGPGDEDPIPSRPVCHGNSGKCTTR